MSYTEAEKQELRDFIKDGLYRYGTFMYQTHGLPLEAYIEKVNSLTMREQMNLLDEAYKDHPKVFKGMKRFKGVSGVI